MSDQQSDQTSRPEVMETLSESQLSELEIQYDQGDHEQFNTLAGSFGWESDTCQQVWDWLSANPRN